VVGLCLGVLLDFGEACRAAQVDHALEVVGNDGEADFSFGALQPTEQQAGMAEDAVLERGEGVLDDTAPQPDQPRRHPLLHAVVDVIVEMTRDQPLRGSGAGALLRTGAAVAGLRLVVDGAVLARYLFPVQGLACGAEEGGIRRWTCGLDTTAPAATSTPRCAGTRHPDAATSAAGADIHTGTASAVARIVARTTRLRSLGTLETQLRHLEPVHETHPSPGTHDRPAPDRPEPPETASPGSALPLGCNP